MANQIKGFLVEYISSTLPYVLMFDFNPETITRSRTVHSGAKDDSAETGGKAVTSALDTSNVTQQWVTAPENFDIEILLDATDRIAEGDPIATLLGVQPEIDTLREMTEPQVQGPSGLRLLDALDQLQDRATDKKHKLSMYLFIWGIQILPVMVRSVSVTAEAHLATLIPYRAKARISMQVVEEDQKFYQVDRLRQAVGATVNTGRTAISVLSGIL